MNKIILALIVLIITIPAFSQDMEEEHSEFRSLSGNKEIKVSGFIAPIMSFTSIGDNFAHMMGGGGGVIFNSFFFGGYGMGQTVEMRYPGGASSEKLSYGHGGLWFGFVVARKWAIHPTFHVQTGWGAIDKKVSGVDGDKVNGYNDGIFIINPIVEIEANITRFLKVGVGGNYSYVYGVNTTELSNEHFTRPGGFVSFKFGWFD
ncbi:MAG: hypothetical protein MI922_06745 [Bacteroidales bacterium]|nr:hypothetical protein [Bacteroidales bacterium]